MLDQRRPISWEFERMVVSLRLPLENNEKRSTRKHPGTAFGDVVGFMRLNQFWTLRHEIQADLVIGGAFESGLPQDGVGQGDHDGTAA